MRSDLGQLAALADRNVEDTPAVPRLSTPTVLPHGPLNHALARLLLSAADSLAALPAADLVDLDAPVDTPASADAPTGSDAALHPPSGADVPVGLDLGAALAARVDAGEPSPAVRVTSAVGPEPLVVADDGLGITPAQARGLLRASVTGVDVTSPLSAEGLGLGGLEDLFLVCLRVADLVELRSRSASHPDARTLGATLHADGKVRVSMAVPPLSRAGTEMRLHVTSNYRGAVEAAMLRDRLASLAVGLHAPVEVDGETLDLPEPEPAVTDDPVDVVDAEPAHDPEPEVVVASTDLAAGVVPTTLGPVGLDRLRALAGTVLVAASDTWSAIEPIASADGLLVIDGRDPGVARVLEGVHGDRPGGPRLTLLEPRDLAAFGAVVG